MALAVDADDARGEVVRRRDEYGVGADAVHEYARAGVHVVDVYVAVLGDQIEDVVLGGGLHGDGKVVLRLGRKEHVDGLLRVGLIAGRRLADLDHVQLAALGAAHREAEESRRLLVAVDLELGEAGGVALDGLRDLALHRVELHAAGDAVVLGRDADEQQPLHAQIGAVVDDLAALEGGVAVEHLDGRRVALHAPVVHGQVGHDADRVHRYPLPEDALLRDVERLHLALHLDVEYLQRLTRYTTTTTTKQNTHITQSQRATMKMNKMARKETFESDDLRGRVHDGRVGGDGSTNRIGRVVQVDDDHLGRLAHLLAHAYELVRLHGERAEADARHVDAHIGQLKMLLEFDWQSRCACHFRHSISMCVCV